MSSTLRKQLVSAARTLNIQGVGRMSTQQLRKAIAAQEPDWRPGCEINEVDRLRAALQPLGMPMEETLRPKGPQSALRDRGQDREHAVKAQLAATVFAGFCSSRNCEMPTMQTRAEWIEIAINVANEIYKGTV